VGEKGTRWKFSCQLKILNRLMGNGLISTNDLTTEFFSFLPQKYFSCCPNVFTIANLKSLGCHKVVVTESCFGCHMV
jgi:hypothetical protein